jgi:signal transduction histidine kinase
VGSVEVRIDAECTPAGRMRITVRDTGTGIRADWQCKGTGVGLRNTRQRLQRLYGPDHEFCIGPGPSGGTLVEIELPATARCASGSGG